MAISMRRLCTRQCPQILHCSERSLASPHNLGGDSSTYSRPTIKSESKDYIRRIPSKLKSLPFELISAIADQLPLVSRHALHLTCRDFYTKVCSDYSKLNVCARYGVLCFMIKDGLINEVNKYACVLCKTLHSESRFFPSQSHLRELGRYMVQCKPSERFCMLHYPPLVTDSVNTLHNRWIAADHNMCTHCGYLERIAKCTCTCESCGVSRVHTYHRWYTGPERSVCYGMNRDEDGTLYIMEGRWAKPIFKA